MITAGQQVTAHAAGSGTGREQFGTRILSRYTPSHWKMLAAEVPVMPPSSRHAGRVQVVTGAVAREVQVAEITGAQAVDLALSAVTSWPASLPPSLRRLVSQVPETRLPAEGGEVSTETETGALTAASR